MFSKVPLGKNAILMEIFHAKKEHFAKGHLANLEGAWPPSPFLRPCVSLSIRNESAVNKLIG